ncbi:ABC transporter permease [Streptococcus saliviloxodontae]|uniref:Osmoprotectant transport system permease protein n=1 Tax=Streptococcus saliviloxodontae TaxID=1349416 RepID=A0ABS2PJS9_9STRE|nr:ABC transporter permease [Streptococcus saliviloxodontae]MBM7635677.1 osmoprotectant transport system permease protein [Streptococcus saliviloxodontae]
MIKEIVQYFAENSNTYWFYLWQHISLSLSALFFALLIGLPLGYMCYRHSLLKQLALLLSQGLRVIPSLGVLFFFIPLIGVGTWPALIALVFLAVPPILLNTILGFSEIPKDLIETGIGLGMTNKELLKNVMFPLAIPYILTGTKLALVEIIASATLATYIGGGGLGTLIFTGLGLYRYDLLVIGGGSVALLSFLCMLVFDLGISGVNYYEK